MSRASEAAMKAYPDYWKCYPFETNKEARAAFIKGYELAEKGIIDYACYELELRLPEYLNYNGIQVERDEFIKDFRKAMEEE